MSTRAYDYSRTANPTRTALEDCVASLEGATYGCAFASGMAAADAVLRQLSPGDAIVLGDDAYGGTYRLVSGVYEPAGFSWVARDLTDPDGLERDWPTGAKLVWLETPTNPGLRVVDIATIAELAHANGALCVVDNTFATPYLQQPLAQGADVVVHSTTKYLGGHSDVVGGLVTVNDPAFGEKLAFVQNSAGAVPGPQDCFPDAPRDQDTCRADGPPLRERRRDRRDARGTPGGLARALPGAADAREP